MAAKYISIVLFNIVSICLHAQTELKSPCPKLFLYQSRDDSTDRWYGLYNLVSQDDGLGVELKLTLDKPALQLGNSLGKVTTYDLKEFTITNRYFRMAANSSHLVRLYVEYDQTKAVPVLVAIEQNGRRICPNLGPSSVSDVFVSVVLQSAEAINPISKSSTKEDEDKIECGTIAAQASPLIVGGQRSKIGEFPWHAVIYRSFGQKKVNVCGGSLVSKNVVVTTVACLLRERRNIEVHLGKFYSRDSGPYVQIHEVNARIPHPQYDDKNKRFTNNVGLMKLKRSATFNDFVRPVCLNPPDGAFEHLIGKIGTIPGWGESETPNSTVELRYATMRVVSNRDCLIKDPQYYEGKSSFCAAPVNGSTPCVGDLGSGLVFPEESKGKKIYYLRGIDSYGSVYCAADQSYYEVFSNSIENVHFIEANL